MADDRTILDTIEPDVAARIASRRDALRTMGGALAVLSAPLALGAMARKAFAQDGGGLPQEVVKVLQFALTLERLEASYYEQALAQEGLIPDETQDLFRAISRHEQEHVQFLEQALGQAAGEPPELDFTAGGRFQPFEDYAQFLLLSQLFEDTGQRAYRGQAGKLAGTPEILTQALTIHSVEARHAARVRMVRDLQPWIPFEQPGIAAAGKPVYAGMGETTKYDVDVAQVSRVDPRQVTEAFDEPLTMQEVRRIVRPFLG